MILLRTPMTFVMFAIFATMVYVSFGYPEGARFMPLVVGVPALLLCALQLFLDLRAAPQQTEAGKDERSEMQLAEDRVSQMTGRHMEFDAANIAPGFKVEENSASEAAIRSIGSFNSFMCFSCLRVFFQSPIFLSSQSMPA